MAKDVIISMKLSLEGHGGEIIIGKLNDNEIEEWKKKSEEDLFQASINKNDICHYSGIYINESLDIILSNGDKESKFSVDDVVLSDDEYTAMGNLEEGYYSIYISEGRASLLSDIEIKEDAIIDGIPDVELLVNGVGELDEVELHTQDDYSICNKLIIKEETYNLEFDDSGLESNLFIIWTDGNYGYEIVYQNSPPAFNGEWK